MTVGRGWAAWGARDGKENAMKLFGWCKIDAYIRCILSTSIMARISTVIQGPQEKDKTKLAAFCAAIDEGDASPDVDNFDEEAFISELKAGWGPLAAFPESH